MRDYEVVYIFRPEFESDEVDDRLESFHERLDGEVTALEHWGQRELAYEIDDERRGYYAVVQFRAEPASLSDFEQTLEHDEDLLRHLLVLSEGEMPTPPSERHADEEDEEDEEEEGEEDEEDEDEDAEADEDEDEAEDEDDEDDTEPEDAGGDGGEAADAGEEGDGEDEDDEADRADDEEK